MTIRVRIAFKDEAKGRSWSVPGNAVPFAGLSVGDLTSSVAEAEAYLARLTGLTVKIETTTD